MGFTIAVLIDMYYWIAYLAVGVAFAMIYLGICMSIETCIVDISLTVTNLNCRIARRTAIKTDLRQLIELHLDCFKYVGNLLDKKHFQLKSNVDFFKLILPKDTGNARWYHSSSDFLSDFRVWYTSRNNFVSN